MESAHPVHPKKAVIRCKAKMRLLQNQDAIALDDGLFQEVANTFFQSQHYQELCKSALSQGQTGVAMDEIAAELALTYQIILQRREEPLIQQLNALL